MLLDGVPLNQPEDAANLADLMTTGIYRLEFVRGPESALFGAQRRAEYCNCSPSVAIRNRLRRTDRCLVLAR